MKIWKQQYEKINKISFYKGIVGKKNEGIQKEFNVADVPTFIFIQNGAETYRIDKFDEISNGNSVPNQQDKQMYDEKTLREKLDEFCKT